LESESLKIKKIHIKNYRTFRDFECEFGDYNVLIGKNNIGKSNLIHAIYAFYTKRATIDDLLKNNSGEPASDEFSITITFHDLTDDEKRELKSYLLKGDEIKIIFKGKLKDGKLNTFYSGYILEEDYIFPDNFDRDLIKLIFNTSNPKREDFDRNEDAKELLMRHCPQGRITREHLEKMREDCVSRYNIQVRSEEKESDTSFQGFIGTKNPTRTGVCIYVPAISKTAAESDKELVNQLIQPFLEDAGLEEARPEYESFQKKIREAQTKRKSTLEERINEELEIWGTTTEISIKPKPIEESIPVELEILFDDGVKTSLDKKGTGLQRFVFFKTLKILNEEKFTTKKSFIFLFEEPEAHLHPQFQREIILTLRKLCENSSFSYQIILTTHSPQFVDIEKLDELFILNKTEDGRTKLSKCQKIIKNKELVRYILIFTPNISEVFFADHAILIEGQSEEITLNYLHKTNKIDLSKTTVIRVEGKYNFLRYLKMLNEIDLTYAILIDDDDPREFKELDNKKLEAKKNQYKETKKIIDEINNNKGFAVILTPDYDKFVGIGGDNKPVKMFNIIKEKFEKKPDKQFQKKIIDLFKLLLKTSTPTNKAIKPDGTEWNYVELK